MYYESFSNDDIDLDSEAQESIELHCEREKNLDINIPNVSGRHLYWATNCCAEKPKRSHSDN